MMWAILEASSFLLSAIFRCRNADRGLRSFAFTFSSLGILHFMFSQFTIYFYLKRAVLQRPPKASKGSGLSPVSPPPPVSHVWLGLINWLRRREVGGGAQEGAGRGESLVGAVISEQVVQHSEDQRTQRCEVSNSCRTSLIPGWRLSPHRSSSAPQDRNLRNSFSVWWFT